MNAEEISLIIRSGNVDNDLNIITAAINYRQELLSRGKFRELQPGTVVRFNSKTRPRYLVGATGKVIDQRLTKVTVKLDNPQGRFNGAPIVVPPNLLDIVS